MLGIVFTEFFDMVEQQFSAEMVEHLIEDVQPASGAIYTSVGYYSHQELVAYVLALAKRSEVPVSELVRRFGHHLFAAFARHYQDMLTPYSSTMQLLQQVDSHIHVEVKKLYPDALTPSFTVLHAGPEKLEIEYRSERNMADLAQGLIEASLLHFHDHLRLRRQDLPEQSATRFSLETF